MAPSAQVAEAASPVVPLSVLSTGRNLGLSRDERDILNYLPVDVEKLYKRSADWQLYEWQVFLDQINHNFPIYFSQEPAS